MLTNVIFTCCDFRSQWKQLLDQPPAYACKIKNEIELSRFKLKCSLLNSNCPGTTKFILIMRCSNYEFALNIMCKYNGLSRGHNHLSELTGCLNQQDF